MSSDDEGKPDDEGNGSFKLIVALLSLLLLGLVAFGPSCADMPDQPRCPGQQVK